MSHEMGERAKSRYWCDDAVSRGRELEASRMNRSTRNFHKQDEANTKFPARASLCVRGRCPV